jgi:hypothetical protein
LQAKILLILLFSLGNTNVLNLLSFAKAQSSLPTILLFRKCDVQLIHPVRVLLHSGPEKTNLSFKNFYVIKYISKRVLLVKAKNCLIIITCEIGTTKTHFDLFCLGKRIWKESAYQSKSGS